MDDDDRCDQCGSTDFTVHEDGLTYCSEGHEQGRGLAVDEDPGDFGQQGKVVRKKREKKKQKISKVFRGAKAYQLFLQSWQFILWKQCHILVHQKGLPPELWTVVRDLWTLWLSRLDHRLQDRADAGTTHTETDNATSSDEVEHTDSESGGRARLERHGKKRVERDDPARTSPKLIDTVALNYLGIILLRRPVGLSTMLSWMQQEDLPFIRAIRHVPQEMVERLPAEYHLSLDTIRIFGADDLQLAVYRCARMFNVSFGMVVPPVNHNLFLLQYVRSLALPLEVYATARRLNTIASYTFSYPDSTSPSTETSARRHPTTYPEAQLMSLVVIATKLLFPFDSETIKRHPKDPNDPTTMRLDWSAWLDAKTHFDNDHKDDDASASPPDLKPGSEIEVTDDQILKMTDRQLDRYMDWYQRTWISTPASSDQQTQTDTSLDKAILDMFPLRDVAVPTKSREQHEHDMQQNQKRLTSRIQRVQASLLPRKAISQEEEDGKQIDILRPGAYYPRFRDVQDLDRAGVPVVRAFHEEAARAACLGLPPLLRAVNHSEEKVDRWLKDQRRREVFGDEDEDEDQDDDEENVGEMIAKNNDIAHQQGPESDLLATSPPTASAGLLARDIGELALLSESPQPPQDAQEDSSQLQDDDEDVEMQMHSEP